MQPIAVLLGVPAALRPEARRVAAVALGLALLIPAPSGAPAAAAAARTPLDRAAPGPPGPTAGTPTPRSPPPPGSTALVSQKVGGGFPNSSSAEPSISADGRYVAFASSGSNLVAAPPGNAPVPAVFVRDRQKGKTSRLPLPPGFAGGGSAREPSISADGSVVAFTYQAPAGFTSVGSIVVAWDRRTGKTEVVSRNSKGSPAGGSREPSVSGNGRFVAFTSDNQDIVPGDNDNADVFRYDRRTRQTRPISVGFSGNLTSSTNSAPSISADGNLVAFVSDGGDVIIPTNTGNGTQVYLRDVRAGRTEQVSVAIGGPPNGASGAPAISGDGNAIAFESAATNLARNDNNEAPDVFLRDRRAGSTDPRLGHARRPVGRRAQPPAVDLGRRAHGGVPVDRAGPPGRRGGPVRRAARRLHPDAPDRGLRARRRRERDGPRLGRP